MILFPQGAPHQGKKIILIADSHIGAYSRGRQLLAQQDPSSRIAKAISPLLLDAGVISRQAVMRLQDGAEIVNPVIVKELHRPSDKNLPPIVDRWTQASPLAGMEHELILMLGFAESHAWGFSRDWRGFSINLGQPSQETHYALPRGMVKDSLDHALAPVLRLIDLLRGKGLRVSTLAGPPPLRDPAFISDRHPGTTPTDAGTRMEIYQMICEGFMTHAALHDYRFLNAPPLLLDEDGFLPEEFADDGIHANAAYGAEMLKVLEKVFL